MSVEEQVSGKGYGLWDIVESEGGLALLTSWGDRGVSHRQGVEEQVWRRVSVGVRG